MQRHTGDHNFVKPLIAWIDRARVGKIRIPDP